MHLRRLPKVDVPSPPSHRDRGRSPTVRPVDDDQEFSGIRCPLCKWHPARTSRWYCDPSMSPEPPFQGCGTNWNTFDTRGRCPGCGHQWHWTSCLQCSGWSLHTDWYEHERDR